MLTKMITRWARIVYRHPWQVVAVALVIAAIGGYLATNIKIRSSFKNLLPDKSHAVIDLDAISKRIGGMGTLTVYIDGANLKIMQRFADDIVKKLQTYPKEEILFVDYKIDAQKKFFERHKCMYLSVKELKELHDEIKKQVAKEKAKANPFFVDLSGGGKKKKDTFNIEEKKEKYEKHLHKFDKFIDGYLTNKEGTALIVILKTPGSNTGVEFAEYFTQKIEKDIAKMNPKKYDKNLEVVLTGEMKTIPAEHEALRNDIVFVSNLCVGLVLLAISLYFRSIRMTVILSIGLLAGVATTFGIVYLCIGYLTAATAFLAAIVAGNGINFGIYFLARYMEERQRNDEIVDVLARAMKGTVVSVSTAAFAAGASYALLMATQFKGFNQFGFIGGVGMLTCLVFALTLNPALTILMERHFPFKGVSKDNYERGRIFSGCAAWLVERFPRVVIGFGIVAIIASIVSLAFFLEDPFEYDFRKLRNQKLQVKRSNNKKSSADAILGERSAPHILLADNFEQVPKIKKALGGYMKSNPDPARRAIKHIKTIYDYLPGSTEEQKEKLHIIRDIRKLIVGNVFKSLSKEKQKEIEDLTPPEDLSVVTMDTLPEELVRPYVELDGTRGTLMYVDMNGSIWNGKPLRRFAGVVQEVKLDDNKIVRSSGKAVIFSDMIRHVEEEGPYATAGAFLVVCIVIAVAFRKKRHIIVMVLSMTTGVLLMMGVAIAFGQKINFLNYIAIPIQFGIGVDYSVNIYSRFLQEGSGSIGRVLRKTGGAVMITSATTIIGYGALWFSVNGALNTFGTLANIGEVTCLIAAILIMPAYLAVFRGGLKRSSQ
ncbi:MAG: MMPL family transporter [Deltaproteobacteria bacterium]|nr:MMPL family transporter [Deltaproteobacteria bacterium]